MSRYPHDAKVYVGDLGNNASKQEIEDAFTYYGPLRNVWVARNPPGFAFVEFEDARDAEDAVRGLDGRTLCGRRARVELSTGKSARYRGPSRSSRGRPFHPEDRCYECGDRGHYARDCSRYGRGGGRGRRRSYSRSRSRSYSRSRSRSRDRRTRSREFRTRSRSVSERRGGGGARSRTRSPRRSPPNGRHESKHRSVSRSSRRSVRASKNRSTSRSPRRSARAESRSPSREDRKSRSPRSPNGEQNGRD